MISFKVTKEELAIIHKIAARAYLMDKKKRARINWEMDLKACHANGTPLDLEKLLNADDFNFAHDVYGIARHICHRTGELLDCFLPRCAAHDEPAAV